jgi:hypothetical protein
MAVAGGDKSPMLIQTVQEVDHYLDQIRKSAASAHAWIAAQSGDPLDLLRRLKFDEVGFHPIEDRPLNLVEQINQTWTYAVALEATRQLLHLHSEAGGYRLAPGAHGSMPLDIMSVKSELVGAETFATVDHRNNRKLERDLKKMAERPEQYRYVFFASPDFPRTERVVQFERDGVRVWSVRVGN